MSEHASADVWLKDIALSAGLGSGFGDDPNRRRELHKRYSRSFAPITPRSST
jgi:uncharacterized protein YeaO (DUF488 family)